MRNHSDIAPATAASSRRPPSLRGGLAPWRAKHVAEYIESNIGRSFHVVELADSVQLSLAHFSREFKTTFGQPPFTYVNMRRVRHAQAIMLNTREPLSQVALACGMCDQSHFIRVFTRVVGVTPGLWRRQLHPGSMGIASQGTADIAHAATEPLAQ